MKIRIRAVIAAIIASTVIIGLGACTSDGVAEYQERIEVAANYDRKDSLELRNLEEKRKREDDPNAVRYVYVMSYATIIGYYVIKGKVSSSASQIAPETEFVRPCSGCDKTLVESPKDDGSYGQGDPGNFFFTTEGVMVEWTGDILTQDQPIAIDVPRLYG